LAAAEQRPPKLSIAFTIAVAVFALKLLCFHAFQNAVGSFLACAIRRKIATAIGGEGPHRWLTIDFTADPRWL